MKSNITFIFLLMALFSFSQIKIPVGFSEVTQSPSNGQKIEKVCIDFDDDSLKDEAVLVENDSEFSNFKLLIYITSLKKQFEVDLISMDDFGIYPIPLKTSKNSIQFGYYEDGTAALGRFIRIRYHAQKEKIQVIGYDCQYRASPSLHVNKSYNVLTGKYIVKKTSFNEAEKGETKEFAGRTDFFENKVFIEDLSLEMLLKLDGVGRKYE